MPAPNPWSDQFIRNLIMKGSMTPPPLADRHVPRWYWPVALSVIFTLMAAAFWYGVYAR